jgi:glycerol kinase
LAIDQGTTNTKALLMSKAGEVLARASRPLSISFPQPGWVEQDARELWSSVMVAIDECLGQVPSAEIAAIGVSNQRESVVVWDGRTREPVGPCVSWQCTRGSGLCAQLRERGCDALVRERSGLGLDPLFSASKAAWLIARADNADIRVGTVDSWLLWNLTGGAVHATDASNASRTQLLNVRRVEWDEDLLVLFGVPAACLPEVRRSSGHFGRTVAIGKLAAGVPVGSLIGDSHAALFGHAAFEPGAVKATYGTGSSLMTLTDLPVTSTHGLSTTIAWGRPQACGGLSGRATVQYALEGNIFNTGAAVQWLGEFLGLPDPVQDAAALARSVPGTAGVYLVPAFAGLGAPVWDVGARGLLFGLSRGTTAAHAARAAVESIAYQVYDVFEAMRLDAGIALPELRADGGASRNDTLMQFQADILGCPVVRSGSTDLSARGAAWLAGLAVGFWNSLTELKNLPQATNRFEPRMPQTRRAELLAGWHDARNRALSRRESA